MANELTFIEQAERKVSTLSNERKCDHDANKLNDRKHRLQKRHRDGS